MKNKKKIPVCVIGVGRIGLTHEFDNKRIKPASHVGMWIENKNCDLIAICDKNFTAGTRPKRMLKHHLCRKIHLKRLSHPKNRVSHDAICKLHGFNIETTTLLKKMQIVKVV